MSRRRDELIWSAGFFDGDGHVSFLKKPHKLRIMMWQSGKRTHLERFEAAVGVGRIYGPYKRKDRDIQIQFFFEARGEDAHRVFELISPWLSEPKRERFEIAIAAEATAA